MLESAHIRNYRIFRDLEIPEFRRINVFTGSNNCGKTSLLEALFLLSRAANPNDLMNSRIVREIPFDPSTANVVQNTLWKPLFSGLDNSNRIEICVKDTEHGDMKLALYLDRSNVTLSPSIINRLKDNSNYESSYEVLIEFNTESGINNQSSVVELDGSVHGKKKKTNGIPYSSTFVSTTRMNGSSIAEKFGTLEMRKQEQPVVSALKFFEPNLRSIRNTSATGQAMLWADIGLDEFLPLAMLGDGMGWVAQMMVSLFTVRDGLLLIDEFDAGIHHSLYPKVWKAINEASIAANVQVIATTHNYECISAIGESLGLDEFRIHRIESTAGRNRCVTYGAEAFSGAMMHGIDVR